MRNANFYVMVDRAAVYGFFDPDEAREFEEEERACGSRADIFTRDSFWEWYGRVQLELWFDDDIMDPESVS